MAQHGKRYTAAREKVDAEKVYPLDEALGLIKEISTSKFDESVELHIKLGIDVSKAEQNVRSTAKLPHPTGMKKRIAVFSDSEDKQSKAKEAGASLVGGEELVKQIAETKKLDFDVAIAEPAMMKHLGRIAKILGPKGLMPSPKSGTVVDDVAKATSDLQSGQITFKNDSGGNIHQMVGKASFDAKTLEDNAKAFIDAVRKARPDETKGAYIKSVTLTSSMGPGIRIQS